MDIEAESESGSASRPARRLLAAGYNRFGQLADLDTNLNHFRPVVTRNDYRNARVLFASWSSTVIISGNTLVVLGHHPFTNTLVPAVADGLKDAFGDQNGMLGCIDGSGRLYLIFWDDRTQTGSLECQSAHSTPRIEHIAYADNGKTAVVVQSAHRRGELWILFQFEEFSDFIQWFHNVDRPRLEFGMRECELPHRPRQLIASTANLFLLTAAGQLYSWGDPRYHSLGRSTDVVGSDEPGEVDDLSGLGIIKIACGGWYCAALSQDGALYVWGSGMPEVGTDLEANTIAPLRGADAGAIVLVEVSGADGGTLDVIDFDVGENHLVFVDQNQQLWVAGANEEGQLGLHSDQAFFDDWVHVPGLIGAEKVVCGPLCTLVRATQAR